MTGRPLPALGTVPGQPGTRPHPVRSADITDDKVARLADGVLVALQPSRAHWSTWNIRGEAQRTARRIRFETPGQRDQFTGRLTEAVTARCVRVDYATTAHTPARYRRRDGSSRFVPENSEIFTTQVLLGAEDALVRWSWSTDAPRLANPGALPRLLPSQADRLLADDYSDALAKELRRSHRPGLDVNTVLSALGGAKPLNEAHPAADLASRVAKAHTAAGSSPASSPPPRRRPTPTSNARWTSARSSSPPEPAPSCTRP